MGKTSRIDGARRQQVPLTELLDRVPPQSLEAERGLLCSLLLDPQLCDEVATQLRVDDFYADAHQKLYRHMLAMHEKGQRLDVALLVEALRAANELEAVGGTAYLGELMEAVPYAANALHYAALIRDKATLRALIHATTETLQTVYDPAVEPQRLAAEAEERIFAVNDTRSTSQVTTIQEALAEAFQRIDARLGGEGGGLPTGFVDLDRLTGGLHEAELIVVAGRPSMGKTALATNIAEYAAIEGQAPTLFVSLEMARLELTQRMLCSQGKIDGNRFRSHFLPKEDRDKLMQASARLGQAPLFIDDTPVRTVSEIAATARRLKRKHKLGLIVIDYLQLIQPDDVRLPRQEQVAVMTRQLKALARRMKIPVIVLAQLNRQVEAGKETHRPKLNHLRESGAIEQDADVVLLIHREEYYHTREEAEQQQLIGKAELIIAKQRNGPTDTVNLIWRSNYTRFESSREAEHEEFAEYQTTEPF